MKNIFITLFHSLSLKVEYFFDKVLLLNVKRGWKYLKNLKLRNLKIYSKKLFEKFINIPKKHFLIF